MRTKHLLYALQHHIETWGDNGEVATSIDNENFKCFEYATHVDG